MSVNIGGKIFTGPVDLVSTPVAVPANFLGIYFGLYPGNSPAPSSMPYKVVCNIDYEGNLGTQESSLCWSSIETSQGVYNWVKMDSWVNAVSANGASILFCVYGIPTFYSSNPGVQGPWSGKFGRGGPLNALGLSTGLPNFLTALITRYGSKILYIQTGTEPNFNTVHVGTGTWWGTAGDLVDFAYVAYTAIKAINAAITVVSPSLPRDQFSNWVNITGTVNTTKRGYDTCDWYSSDIFNAGPPAFGFGIPYTNSDGSYTYRQDSLTALALIKQDTSISPKPIAVTSFGFDEVQYSTNGHLSYQASVLAQSALWRKQWLARTLLIYAAAGVKMALCYSYDSAYIYQQFFCGDFIGDTNGVVAAFNEIAANVCGKTIISCTYYHGGVVSAKFSDLTTYTI